MRYGAGCPNHEELEHQDSPAPNTPYALPVPYSLLPVPCSLFPAPYSLFPIPYSLFPLYIFTHQGMINDYLLNLWL
ncbi:hypothetical protein [Moorena sp. SIO3I6]|uniref:hypothetical protein n=1 Tax=Moorena sp. SIO3I6 TaxID=2607831 RepID=UPI0013F9E16C|nr:hypothetical protein [Moorena sp. SIO3I6]NEP26016.1 hypothetical protein [Moorena sp. SIO3I6]